MKEKEDPVAVVAVNPGEIGNPENELLEMEDTEVSLG